MKKATVYDLPTRLFHWSFAGLFVAAFAIAQLVDDESSLFSHHMMLGLILAALVLVRLAWGLTGSRYARFSSFPLNPRSLFEYFRDLPRGKERIFFGHNPASAWAAVLMMGLALGLGVTGFLMATGRKEAFEDVHELLANGFAFVAAAHVVGVILHGLRHRDGLALSIIHGKKDRTGDAMPLARSHRLAAMTMAGLVGLFAFHVYRNYDPARSTTRVFGVTLQLAETDEAAD